jgi:outer membrane receptor for ferric coprogen and ferric-rhodotorulic acid
VMYQFSQQVSAAIRVENLFDTQIETGKSADGILSIGAPRLVTFQVRWQF